MDNLQGFISSEKPRLLCAQKVDIPPLLAPLTYSCGYQPSHFEDAGSNIATQEMNSPPPDGLGTHLKKYWVHYVIAKLILLAILLPLTFLVIFPAIGQVILNHQELILHTASLLNPAPGDMTFDLISSLTVPKPFTVVLDATNMSLFVRTSTSQTPYVYLELPQQKLHGNATINIAPQRARIVDTAQWLDFLNASLYQEHLVLSARGTSIAHFGKLKAKLTLDKDIKIKGLNKLQGFSVRSAVLQVPADAHGHNLKGTLVLPNTSPVTFDLGNQSFDLKLQDLQIGTATVYNLTLEPGDNLRDLYGTLDFDKIISNIETVLHASAPALSAGNLELWTTGSSTIYNGQHIPYYETLLGGLELQANVSLADVLVGSLGSMLNGSASDIQNIMDLIAPALNPMTDNIHHTRRSLMLDTDWNDPNSMKETMYSVAREYTRSGCLELGELLGAVGNAIGAVMDGISMAMDVFENVMLASRNKSATILTITEVLNCTALAHCNT